MLSYLLKLLAVVIVWFFVSYFYYKSWHKESFSSWYIIYLAFIWVIYSVYKIYTLFIDYKEKLRFSPFNIFSLFLVQLWFFSWLYFDLIHYKNYFLVLFFSIIWNLILPILISIISFSFWKKIINFIEEKFSKEDEKQSFEFNFLMSVWLWFTSFISILVILWILWFYNLYSVFGTLVFLAIISYKELKNTLINIFKYKIEINNHNLYSNDILEKINPKLLTTEFLFIVISLLIATNYISIFRPSPIWWDDMWVYMNYPNLMAHAWSLIPLGQMVSWQVLTWIWYMFDSPTQAFFLNNLWSFWSVIVIILSINYFVKDKKTFINIPFLMASIFLAMPVVIFQQAKDMKLDTWLFFISVIALFWAIYIFLKYIWYKNSPENKCEKSLLTKIIDYFKNHECLGNHKLFYEKKYIIYLFLIWILSGFAFSIKITSLFLISWIIWIISYAKLWFAWFLAYLSIFIWIFTEFKLWDYMWAINYPKDNSSLNSFFITTIIIWAILLLYSLNKYSIKNFKRFFLLVFIYLTWIFVALLPFFAKHLIEIKNSWEPINIWSIISWKNESFKINYEKIYSKNELQKINKNIESAKISSSWTTTNEDFWRYFWYEKWLNNYLKLPWNLTMQTNQAWEFTDITYIFLALIPVIFLFLRFKNNYFIIPIILILILEFFTFYKPENIIIPNNEIKIDKNLKNKIFSKNSNVFQDKLFNDDIFDIKFENYISDYQIKKFLKRKKELFEKTKNNLKNNFYINLAKKIKSWDIKENTKIWWIVLTKKDRDFALKLSKLYNNYSILKIKSKDNLEDFLNKNNIKNKKNLEKIYLNHRTINQKITDYLWKYTMPVWYFIILSIFLSLLAYLLYFLKKDKQSQIIRLNSIFLSFYVFLWTISAFWVIWYWIVMFYSFLALIAISLYYLSSYDENIEYKEKIIRFFSSIIIFILISNYFFLSSYPHAFKNIKISWWTEYKAKIIPWEDLIFLYDKNRFDVLANLNIAENKQKDFLNFMLKDIKNKNIKIYFDNLIKKSKNIIEFRKYLKQEEIKITTKIAQILYQKNLIKKDTKINSSYQILRFPKKPQETKKLYSYLREIKNIENKIYKNLLYPKKEFKSKDIIYRLWTFYKYFISDNNKRLFEDSLLTSFKNYIKSDDINKSVERIKKLWLKYILLDLNAATIDRDPRHNLTKRYEDFLKMLTSNKLELLKTDSICLKVWLETYKKNKNLKEFYNLAWVNYNSFKNWKIISKSVKRNFCLNYILNLKRNKKINKDNYPYLQWLNRLDENQSINYIKQLIGRNWWMFALFKVK